MATVSMDRWGLRTAAHELLDDVGSILGLPRAGLLLAFRQALDRPAVIAVTGRVNTGKSTLVNSLLSAKMAPTSAQETTALLSCYAYGAPARAQAALKSGQMVPIPLTEAGPGLGDIPPEAIENLRVFLQAAALLYCTVIDTPGLSSAATDNSSRTESGMLDGRDPSLDPDVLLFLVRDAFRPDDEHFITRFRERGGAGTAQEPVPVIGLVSHADNFGGGPWHAAEPTEEAGKAAAGIAARMPHLAAVLPVSGLLAETARTGALREQDVRNLRVLQDSEDVHLQFAEQLGPPPGVRLEDFQRLTRLVGAYGIRFGREHCGSAGQLMEWLDERSGMARLERVLHTEVSGPTECSRVEDLLTGLLAAARTHSWPSEARVLVESARHAPVFHRLQEQAALTLLRASAPHHELVGVLKGFLQEDARTPTVQRAGTGDSDDLKLASHYQSMVGTASTGAEARAARTIARSLLIRSGTVRTQA